MHLRHSLAIAAALSAALAAGAAAQQPKKPETPKKATTHAATTANPATAKPVAATKPAATTKAAPAATAHAAPVAAVSDAPPMSEAKPGLLKQAKAKPESARAAALKEVSGRITRQRIEERGGKLVYAFWIRPARATRSQTVLVDAGTGRVVKGTM